MPAINVNPTRQELTRPRPAFTPQTNRPSGRFSERLEGRFFSGTYSFVCTETVIVSSLAISLKVYLGS